MVSAVVLARRLGPLARATAVGSQLRALTREVPVVLLLGWWVTRLTWDGGGRDPRVLSVAGVLAAVAVVAVRPDRHLTRFQLILPTAIAVGAWAVVATSPTGWGGANDAANYTVAAATFTVVATWATDLRRRSLVIIAVLAAGGWEFAQAWLPWWGQRNPAAQMYGTFYWHNQFGIFLVPAAVVGGYCIAANCHSRPLRWIAWIVTPLAIAGVVFSASRGSEIALLVGLVTMAVGLAWARRWSGAGRLLSVGAISAGLVWLLSGPPFFTNRAGFAASTSSTASTLVTNGTERLEDWRRGISVFLHWPFTGAGFHSFFAASTHVTTYHDSNFTAFVHNGYLQAFSDGGLFLGLPVVLACAVMAYVSVRCLAGDAKRRQFGLESALAVSALLLLLHSGMDFDWSYPALTLVLAIVAGVLVSARAGGTAVDVSPPRTALTESRLRLVAVTAFVAALAVGVVGAWHGDLHFNLPLHPGAGLTFPQVHP